MNGTTFDTLAAKAPWGAGFNQRQAEAAADVMRSGRAGLATKADLDTLRTDMRGNLYRALWIQTGAIAGTAAAAMKFL